jgi:hypothetical protein
MTRSVARRTDVVQAEKSPPPIAAGVSAREGREPPPAAGVPWYWRLALFLWSTSFVFLLLYEWLAGILKAWRQH